MLQTLNTAMTIYNKNSDDKDCTEWVTAQRFFLKHTKFVFLLTYKTKWFHLSLEFTIFKKHSYGSQPKDPLLTIVQVDSFCFC